MDKRTKYEVIDTLDSLREQLMIECFAIQRNLTSETYENHSDQLDDMVILGELAETCRLIWRSAGNLRKLDLEGWNNE